MFNFIRFRKIKEDVEIKNLEVHNFRLKKIINADENRKYLNKTYMKHESHLKAFSILKEKYKFKTRERGKNKTVKFLEFVISASSDFFKDKSRDEIEKYFLNHVEILKNNFFKVDGSLVSMTFHFDEMTPHAHLVFVPIVKNEDNSYSISSKKLFGDQTKCTELQDLINKELNELGWGLKRGNKLKKTTHKEVKHFYQEVEERKNEYESLLHENELMIQYLIENGLKDNLERWLGFNKGVKRH